jgi:hypothetical protein
VRKESGLKQTGSDGPGIKVAVHVGPAERTISIRSTQTAVRFIIRNARPEDMSRAGPATLKTQDSVVPISPKQENYDGYVRSHWIERELPHIDR